VNIIGQLARKPFSNGKVGMFGLSWSAFNALMIAARNPPDLKAILAAHVSDDLFYQDVHFIDGVFHMDVWEGMMDTFNALPAPDDYALSAEFFTNRFDREPWIFTWKEHMADGPFWRKESIRFKNPVRTPIYVIGGLLDGYRDTVPRLLDSPNPNVKAEIGPWTHDWPDTGEPGPNYEWRNKAVRWWDYWLKGIPNGVMDEPRFMAFMRDGHPPSFAGDSVPGQWRCGDWPLKNIETRPFYLGPDNQLIPEPPPISETYTLDYWSGAGTAVHGWWGEMADDMADDDENSLVFDTPPLTKAVEIIGFPKVRLRVAADAPLYQFTVRLEDVFPDGRVSLVSGALIHPADRESRLARKALVPGQPVMIAADIHFTTWRFQPGHIIRLAVGNAQFPMAWPTPYKGKTSLFTGPGVELDLPVTSSNPLTARCSPPRPEPREESSQVKARNAMDGKAVVDYNEAEGVTTYTTGDDETFTIGDVSVKRHEKNRYTARDADPAHASYTALSEYAIDLPGRALRFDGQCNVTSDEKNFHIEVTRRLSENGKIVREKRWDKTIPRNLQ
jgi:hypothetical protein